MTAKPATFTWTCPRCKLEQTSTGAPNIPANCPRCNFPDEPSGDWKPTEREIEQPTEGELQVSAPEIVATEPVGPTVGTSLDRGWLAYVLVQALQDHDLGDTLATSPSDSTVQDFVTAVADLYEGERPTMLCGCLAGTHGATLADIEAAHPERKHA